MDEVAEPRGSSLATAALLGSLLALLLVPGTLFALGALEILRTDALTQAVLTLAVSLLLLLMAVAGLSTEVDDLREALLRAREPNGQPHEGGTGPRDGSPPSF